MNTSTATKIQDLAKPVTHRSRVCSQNKVEVIVWSVPFGRAFLR